MKILILLTASLFYNLWLTPDCRCIVAGNGTLSDSLVGMNNTEKTDSILPEFNYVNVRDYVFKNIIYPKEAKEHNIQGTVWISFVINGEGRTDSIKVTRSLHPLLDKEASRLIRDMPQWKPLLMREGQLSLPYKIPVIFELLDE